MVRVSFAILFALMAGSALALPQIQNGEIFSATANNAAPTSSPNPQSTNGTKPSGVLSVSPSDISAAPITTSTPASPDLAPLPGPDNSTLVASHPKLQDVVDQGHEAAAKIAANSTVKTRDLNSISKRKVTVTCGNGIVSLDPLIWLLAAERFCDTEFGGSGTWFIQSGSVLASTLGLPGGYSVTITLSVPTAKFPYFLPITQGTCKAYFANSIVAMSQNCLFYNGFKDTNPATIAPFYPFITEGSIS